MRRGERGERNGGKGERKGEPEESVKEERKRRWKRPQILFQVKGFLSRHLPCAARGALKIKMTSRNVFSLSAFLFSSFLFRQTGQAEPRTVSRRHFIFPPRWNVCPWRLQPPLDFKLIRLARDSRATYYPPRDEIISTEESVTTLLDGINPLIGGERKSFTMIGEMRFQRSPTHRFLDISGAPGRIDPTSSCGNGFSLDWEAEACRSDRGDRSRSGSCKENVNRCLDTYTCVHRRVPRIVRTYLPLSRGWTPVVEHIRGERNKWSALLWFEYFFQPQIGDFEWAGKSWDLFATTGIFSCSLSFPLIILEMIWRDLNIINESGNSINSYFLLVLKP